MKMGFELSNLKSCKVYEIHRNATRTAMEISFEEKSSYASSEERPAEATSLAITIENFNNYEDRRSGWLRVK